MSSQRQAVPSALSLEVVASPLPGNSSDFKLTLL